MAIVDQMSDGAHWPLVFTSYNDADPACAPTVHHLHH